MKAFFAILAICLMASPCSRADYAIPAMPVALARVTDILDVKVVSMNGKGHAKIEVLKAYKSSKRPAKVITGVDLSCTGGSPKLYGMKSGQRYIVLLTGSHLYEEQSYFPVKHENGITQCKPGWYGGKTWLKCKGEWISLLEFERKISAAMSAGQKQ